MNFYLNQFINQSFAENMEKNYYKYNFFKNQMQYIQGRESFLRDHTFI